MIVDFVADCASYENVLMALLQQNFLSGRWLACDAVVYFAKPASKTWRTKLRICKAGLFSGARGNTAARGPRSAFNAVRCGSRGSNGSDVSRFGRAGYTSNAEQAGVADEV